MMEQRIIEKSIEAVKSLFGAEAAEGDIQLQQTKKEFEGELTLVVFPLLRYSRRSPEETAETIGKWLEKNIKEIESFNVVKGFLNLSVSAGYYISMLNTISLDENYGFTSSCEGAQRILVEYSSPNTNKPLHLGHIRNNLIGYSLSRILGANGNEVIKTNIVNDRGIHICKSMLAWVKYGKNETPGQTGEKGDHFVGRFYVRFEQEYRKQKEELVSKGYSAEEAAEKAELIAEAREMLRKWEKGDSETVALWEKMNSWVYEGFDITYRAMGVDFDKVYYESDTYRKGRAIVHSGLEKGVFYTRDDGSVWCNLESEGLDEKLLLRSDGTAVYMTQDIGTAIERHSDYKFDRHIYVVGNEQNYHFQVLKLLLGKLGYPWYKGIHHYSYGMVELPDGKMKSREGKVVDADDLIGEMIKTAADMSGELGKLGDYEQKEKEEIFRKIGLGALKYFILKVDPRKNMMFNPEESIDFNGNTGPFIQYTYARIKSVLRKAGELPLMASTELDLNHKEQDLIISVSRFPAIVKEAGESLSPALIANYCYNLARDFNQFYHDYSILNEADEATRDMRIILACQAGLVLEKGMWLLGIEMPERM